MVMPSLREIKKANPEYFSKENDEFFGTYKWEKKGYIVSCQSEKEPSVKIERIADPKDNLQVRTTWNNLGPNEDKFGFRRFFDDKNGCVHVIVNRETGLIEEEYIPEGDW